MNKNFSKKKILKKLNIKMWSNFNSQNFYQIISYHKPFVLRQNFIKENTKIQLKKSKKLYNFFSLFKTRVGYHQWRPLDRQNLMLAVMMAEYKNKT